MPYIGRTNQYYCSNAHKVKAFRLREKEGHKKLANIKMPISFSFQKPLSIYEKKSAEICIELNLINWVIELTKESSNVQGNWRYEEMENYFEQEIEFNLAKAKTLQQKIDNGLYSARFKGFIAPHISQIINLCKQLSKNMKKILKENINVKLEEQVEVKFDQEFINKMEKLKEKYTSLWFSYKRMYL
jgi:hypothetical protein